MLSGARIYRRIAISCPPLLPSHLTLSSGSSTRAMRKLHQSKSLMRRTSFAHSTMPRTVAWRKHENAFYQSIRPRSSHLGNNGVKMTACGKRNSRATLVSSGNRTMPKKLFSAKTTPTSTLMTLFQPFFPSLPFSLPVSQPSVLQSLEIVFRLCEKIIYSNCNLKNAARGIMVKAKSACKITRSAWRIKKFLFCCNESLASK